MERYELPDGWRWVSVRIVADSIQYGFTAKSSEQFNGPLYLRITDIQNGKVNWDSVPQCEISDDDLEKYRLASGDIVFARSGATAGKSYLLKDPPLSVFASYLIRVRTNNQVLPEYLAAFFKSKDYWDQVITRGNAQPNANAQVLGAVTFPLPPLPEQHRIVKKIESLFAEARTARAALERAEPLLRKSRRAVLSAAFRGALTERDANDESASMLLERIRAERIKKWQDDLRAKGKDATKVKFVEAEPPNTRDLGNLPKGWEWVNTAMLAADEPHSFTDGPFGSNLKTEDYVNKGVRVIRLQNLGVSQFKDKDKAYISEEKYQTLRKHETIAGDVIIAALGDPLGRTCIVPEGIGTAIVKADCIRLRVNSELALNKYVMLALNTVEHFRRAEAAAHGVGRVRANFSDVKAFVVPLAPLAEQQRIVERIESLFAQAEQIEHAVEIARRRAEKVEQAILARAFRGEL